MMVVMGEVGRFDPSRFIWMMCQLFGDSHRSRKFRKKTQIKAL